MGSIEESPILIVGAGPIGMLLAYQLARLGVPCILAEQSHTTTRWPKMDLTNCRSMEILRMLGICDAYRALSVPEQYNLDSHFSTGMGPGAVKIASWVSDTYLCSVGFSTDPGLLGRIKMRRRHGDSGSSIIMTAQNPQNHGSAAHKQCLRRI